KLKKHTNILEIGCGTSEGITYNAEKTNAECVGIDLSKQFIEIASKNNKKQNLQFTVADFNDPLSFTGDMTYGKFDYVVGNGILHHLYYNLDSSLINLNKLLRPGGKIIFIEPNIYNPYIFLIFKFPYFRKKA